MKSRQPAELFELPLHELRNGYRSDIYFWREKRALEEHKLHPAVTMQVFQKNHALLCGMDEGIAVLRGASGYYRDYHKAERLFQQLQLLQHRVRQAMLHNRDDYRLNMIELADVSAELDELWVNTFNELKIEALFDGNAIEPWESVMHINGEAAYFAHLETIYLGILARRTRIATNVKRAVEAANGTPVLYFSGRFDHWAVQEGDGYAAFIGGAFGASVASQCAWTEQKPIGTVPHALIASVNGDTPKAVRIFGETYPDVNLVALVDFDNDCVNTSIRCCEALGENLWGVRLDTAQTMVDKSMIPVMGESAPTGVTPELAEMTRKALDDNGFKYVKIVVSGGFTSERIAHFEKLNAPVDAYGIGTHLLDGAYDFTADIVKPVAKEGRRFKPNPRFGNVT
ncbi:quinolinate phosphoribosyl transferase [Verrucomicrobiota bacterium]